MLVEFLIDELPNIGSEGISCKPDLSSRKLEEDVDFQPESEANSDDDPEDVSSDVNVNESLKDIENENVEFLADELPIMGIKQQSKGSICNSDSSSSNMDGDDDAQAGFGAYLNVDLESDVDGKLEVNADLKDAQYVEENKNVSIKKLEEPNLGETTSSNSSTFSNCSKYDSVLNEEKDYLFNDLSHKTKYTVLLKKGVYKKPRRPPPLLENCNFERKRNLKAFPA